jgi:hypothetical protein
MSEAIDLLSRKMPGRKRRLKLPVIDSRGLRIAQIGHQAFFDEARPFPAARWHELAQFAPNVLIGSASELRRVMERVDLQTVDLSSVDHAVFAITELGDKPLGDVLRVVLWQRLGVPVYELYIGPDRNLLAAQCEAQDGWHVQPCARFTSEGGQLFYSSRGGEVSTGLEGDLVFATCGCGRPGARILLHGSSSIACDDPMMAATA